MIVLQRLGTCVVIVVPPNIEMKQRFNIQTLKLQALTNVVTGP